MPTYSFKCPVCLNRFEEIRKVADYDKPATCSCGTQAERQLSAPAVRGDYQGYSCPVTGTWIEGRKAHQENLKRHGCRVLEPGETSASRQRAAEDDSRLEKAVEETADRFIAGLSSDKKAQLASEVSAGVTAAVVRQ